MKGGRVQRYMNGIDIKKKVAYPFILTKKKGFTHNGERFRG